MHIHMARLRLENEDDCVDDDDRGMTVMWHLPTSELHGVGGPWGEKDEQLIILIPPTIHVDKKEVVLFSEVGLKIKVSVAMLGVSNAVHLITWKE